MRTWAVALALLAACSELEEAETTRAKSEAEAARAKAELDVEKAAVEVQKSPAVPAADAAPAEEPPPADFHKVPLTKAARLYADYDSNEISADTKYKRKWLCVEGRVQKVGTDIMDTPTVLLSGSSGYDSVVFAFENKTNLEKLKKGQAARICGVCAGSSLGSPLLRRAVVWSIRE